LFCLCLLCGCGGNQSPVGRWTGSFKASANTLPLELKADHTFKLTIGETPAEGTWSQSGSQVSLKIEKEGGMTMDEAQQKALNAGNKNYHAFEPMVLTLSDDGVFMIGHPPGPNTPEVSFKRN
jgi:hypothetical protein